MSMQIEINSNIVKYLASNGYRSDPIIDELVQKTKELNYIITKKELKGRR